MISPLTAFIIALGLCLLQFAFAFVAGAYPDSLGFGGYVYAGLALLFVLLLIPFVLKTPQSILLRFVFSFGFVALGSGAWLVGLFNSNIRIITRLM